MEETLGYFKKAFIGCLAEMTFVQNGSPIHLSQALDGRNIQSCNNQ
jgi:hypothetical protein